MNYWHKRFAITGMAYKKTDHMKYGQFFICFGKKAAIQFNICIILYSLLYHSLPYQDLPLKYL